MTDLEFVNHPRLKASSKTLAWWKEDLRPLSFDWKMVEDDYFHMNHIYAVSVYWDKPNSNGMIGLSFLKGVYEHSRYKTPAIPFPKSLISFDPMI